MFLNVVVRTVRRRLPTNCKYAEGSFTKRNANSFCVGRTLTARYLVTERNSNGLFVCSVATVRWLNNQIVVVCTLQEFLSCYTYKNSTKTGFRMQ